MSEKREFMISPDDPSYGIRPCRGSHWHVTAVNDDGTEGDDLWLNGEPDNYPTAQAALDAIVRASTPPASSSVQSGGVPPTELSDEHFDEDAQVCLCDHTFREHSGRAFGYQCCAPRCECKGFQGPPAPETSELSPGYLAKLERWSNNSETIHAAHVRNLLVAVSALRERVGALEADAKRVLGVVDAMLKRGSGADNKRWEGGWRTALAIVREEITGFDLEGEPILRRGHAARSASSTPSEGNPT